MTLILFDDECGTLLFVCDFTFDSSFCLVLVDSWWWYKDFIEISIDFVWEIGFD